MPTPFLRSTRVAFTALAVTCLALAGCGPSSGPGTAEGRTKPKGKILENGLPIKVRTENLPPGDPGMKVTFVTLGGSNAGDEINAQIIDAKEGTFELIGADAKGIPPGKYRVVIVMAPEGGTDYFKGKYSREKSKIEVEVKANENLVIDVAQFEKAGK
jgi:hypothetical protein